MASANQSWHDGMRYPSRAHLHYYPKSNPTLPPSIPPLPHYPDPYLVSRGVICSLFLTSSTTGSSCSGSSADDRSTRTK